MNASASSSHPLPADLLADLESQPVETRSLPTSPVSPAQVRSGDLTLSDLWLPAVTLSSTALEHNLDRFAAWCRERRVALAPHGKTTMAPRLWSAQLARSAWAITAATPAQARVMRRYGVPRVMIANEVVDPEQIAWLGAEAEGDAEVLCLVDSWAGINLMEHHLAASHAPVPVLVEIGVPGRRTGVRGVEEALRLLDQVLATPTLRLAGIEGYEGVLPQLRDGDAEVAVRRWLNDLVTLAVRADERGLWEPLSEVIVSAGGSGYPDLVADALATIPELSRPTRHVIRSGCYITHDDLSYERSSPLRTCADADPLQPALSCYARVLSNPEDGRVLLGVGKRDIAFDIDFPVPRAVHRDGRRIPLVGALRVVELNDHHAFCDSDEADTRLYVGDVVELGLSHPCTVFDKWPLIPVLDDAHRVVDAIRTLF